MPPIDLGLTYDEAMQIAKPAPIPDGRYEFTVESINDTPTNAGRPRWSWRLSILNRPDLGNRKLFYSTPLTWVNPATGERDTSGLNFLISMLEGLGRPWTGKALPDKETFYGATGILAYSQKPNKIDPGTMDENIKIISKKPQTHSVA